MNEGINISEERVFVRLGSRKTGRKDDVLRGLPTLSGSWVYEQRKGGILFWVIWDPNCWKLKVA
jgi:hypothetical protein